MANTSNTRRESASRLLSRMLGRDGAGEDTPSLFAEEAPATARNHLVALRAERSEVMGRKWGVLTARDPDLTTPAKIRDALAAVRAQDDQWLKGVLDGAVKLPDERTPSSENGGPDAALAAIKLQITYGQIFDDVDTLRETADDAVARVHERLRSAVDTPGATFPRGGVESGRAVLAEVEREMKLRPKARALASQRAYESAERHMSASVSPEVRSELAGEARRNGERWWGVDPDNQEALDFLSSADRQYSAAVVDAEPAWLEKTLGVDPTGLEVGDSYLASQRDMLAEQIAHSRFGRENLADVAPRLDALADMRLLKGIREYQEAVGMIASPLGESQQQGIEM